MLTASCRRMATTTRPNILEASMDYEQILYEVNDGVALMTLNRPEKLNALTALMGAEMGDAMAEADADDAVRAVVMTGAGRAFCAGADLGAGSGFAAGWGGVEREYRRMLPMQVRKPVIAALNGPAVGAGLAKLDALVPKPATVCQNVSLRMRSGGTLRVSRCCCTEAMKAVGPHR